MTKLKLLLFSVFLLFPEMAINPASATTAGGQDGFGGETKEAVVRTETLLRANDFTLRVILRNYLFVRTNEGFSSHTTEQFIKALLADGGYTRQLLKKVTRYRSEKLRKSVLVTELKALNNQLNALEAKIDGPRFERLLPGRKRLVLGGLVKPQTVEEERLVELYREYRKVDKLRSLVEAWVDEPNTGPGGTVTISR